MRGLAAEIGVGVPGLQCADIAYRLWQGGNQWAGEEAFLSFFRHVAKLDLDYTAWDAWETLALHSGPRTMHADFCIISDRPELLTVDDRNRPHSDKGPFCRWRDGTALYSVHGVRVPAWIVEQPEKITVAAIDAEENAETRRVMIDRYGPHRFVIDSGATVIDECDEAHELIGAKTAKLLRREVPGDEAIVVIDLLNSTPEPDGSVKRYQLRVPPSTTTVLEGLAWGYGFTAQAQYRPSVET